jgi:shikimate dehydrogenase
MYPKIDASPIDLSLYKECEAVLDIIYNPLKTKLLLQAEELGIKAVNGLEMLVAQAKYAVEYFLDKAIDDTVIDEVYHMILKEL